MVQPTEEELSIWDKLLEPILQDHTKSLQGRSTFIHYTSFPALKGIIERKEIWLSPVSCMNDTAEVQYGKELIHYEANENGQLLSCFEAIGENHPALWKEISNEFYGRIDHDLAETFVSCFSQFPEPWKDKDDRLTFDCLTMWRAYGASGNGVALGLNPEIILRNPLLLSSVMLAKVKYETDVEFVARAKRYFSHFSNVVLAMNDSDLNKNEALIVGAFTELSFYLAVTHKHPSFRDEQEIRLTWNRKPWNPHYSDSFVRSELAQDGLFERFCMPFRDNGAEDENTFDLSKALQFVLVGPCENSKLKKRAVETLLNNYGFEGTVVQESDIPFRSKRY